MEVVEEEAEDTVVTVVAIDTETEEADMEAEETTTETEDTAAEDPADAARLLATAVALAPAPTRETVTNEWPTVYQPAPDY